MKGKIQTITKLKYDKKNRETKTVDYNIKGQKTGTYSISKYKDRKDMKEHKLFINRKLYKHLRTYFKSDGTIKYFEQKMNGKWIRLDPEKLNENVVTTRIENYNNLDLNLIRTSIKQNEDMTILGIKGKLKLSLGDDLLSERYLLANGLSSFEKQFLNGNLIGIKKYNYIRH